jgi:hypothetical protein
MRREGSLVRGPSHSVTTCPVVEGQEIWRSEYWCSLVSPMAGCSLDVAAARSNSLGGAPCSSHGRVVPSGGACQFSDNSTVAPFLLADFLFLHSRRKPRKVSRGGFAERLQ